MNPTIPAAETCEQIVREKVPNFFRLYLNPYLVQTCYCLSAYVRSTWGQSPESEYQTFLANSFDEALGGAIKLARYCANLRGQSSAGLILDPGGRLGPFASVSLGDRGRIDFVPNLTVVDRGNARLDTSSRVGDRFGFVVLVASPGPTSSFSEALRLLLQQQRPLLITCVDRDGLTACRQGEDGGRAEATPDIVVFDESFVNHEVPFGAFTARKSLYHHWNQRGKATFHSTTFQPNTIASLHFLKCLAKADPAFLEGSAPDLERIRQDPVRCRVLLKKLYSPFLARAVRTVGLDTLNLHAAGHYVVAGRRRIFDGVAGVACSIRGHNPEHYVHELQNLGTVPDWHAAATARLRELTGLPHLLPAVSGATAVENALKLGLVAQFPKKYVLAFQGGFGGKTLFALTGTARAAYKEHLHPLYEHVLYLDPFGPKVLEELESAFRTYPIAVVQLELIQAVGGVRPIPAHVLEYLESHKSQWGYLLFVDEVQTGMYRTGPFSLAQQLGLRPDLLTVGKGTSDMMFPFALTLYGESVRARVEDVQPGLPETLRQRFGYEGGYRTVLNVLKQAEVLRLPEKVAESGALFARLLAEELRSSPAVRDVRVHGLLIGIELETSGWPRRLFRKRMSSLIILNLLRHASFPLFVGFCQYEPNVLKLTPPLTITPDEVRQVCAALGSVLRLPFAQLMTTSVGALLTSPFRR
ncbi:MAG: aminotransferase class III-fold pyridoxal phosphate-dependent enzyme [Planctomycetes bacterium]|nr:aminotransferase class III-fold pyridoxal phosphate-dependent enzyme [Planctomycetota bacterium]